MNKQSRLKQRLIKRYKDIIKVAEYDIWLSNHLLRTEGRICDISFDICGKNREGFYAKTQYIIALCIEILSYLEGEND